MFEISGKGVMGRITRPLPLPDPWGLPAPYPILPLPDWGLTYTEHEAMENFVFPDENKKKW